MDIRMQNDILFSTKYSVDDSRHCGCEDCVFYAENIMKNIELVQFLSSLGVDAQKADEAWCKMKKDGFKYFSVDYFRLYSEMEGTFKFDNVIVEIGPALYREKEQPTHWMGIEAVFSV